MKKCIIFVVLITFCLSWFNPMYAQDEPVEPANVEKVYTIMNNEKYLCWNDGMKMEKQSDNKDWLCLPNENGTYTILSLYNGKALTLKETKKHKKKLTLESFESNESQEWILKHDFTGRYSFYNGGYLSYNKEKFRIVEDIKKATYFEFEYERPQVDCSQMRIDVSSISVPEVSDAKGNVLIQIENPVSDANISYVKLELYASDYQMDKVVIPVYRNEAGNYSYTLTNKEFKNVPGNYTLRVKFVCEGNQEIYYGNYNIEELDIYDGLQTKIEKFIKKRKNKGENWQVYLKNLDTGGGLNINSHKSQSASLMKLFVMGTIYSNYKDTIKRYGKETVDSALRAMITVSSNEAWYQLVCYLGNGDYGKGADLVSKWAHKHGYIDVDTQGKSYYNFTSTENCVHFVEDIYNHRYKHSDEMLELLLDQRIRHKIPSKLPKDVKVGNKTGELGWTENDCGIIYGKNGTYILCVMSDQLKSTQNAQDMIGEISKMVYKYLNV